MAEKLLHIDIGASVTFSMKEFSECAEQSDIDALQSFLQAELEMDNPAFFKTVHYARSRFAKRVPKTLKYWYLRKPKTNPTIEIPIGMLQPLAEFLKALGFKLIPVDFLIRNSEEFTSSVKLREYQKPAVDLMLGRHRGLLVAPCGAGKTVMGIEMIARRAMKSLVIVHTLDLMMQWKQSIKSLLDIDASLIGNGKKDFSSSIVIGTVQTLVRDKKLLQQLGDQCGTVIIDECHHTPATTFTKVVSSLKPCYLYGVSATPEREDGMTPVMHMFLGPVLARIQTADLQKTQFLLKPSLEIVPTQFLYPYDKENPDDYHNMMESLVSDRERNELIIEKLLFHENNINLILSQRVKHLESLYELLCQKVDESKVAMIMGKTPKEERNSILDKAREGKITYLLATQLADEGLDIRCLERVWMVMPSRNPARVEQRIGRVMRLCEGKSSPVVYDFVDPVPILKSQFKTRFFRVYVRLLKTGNIAV
jgi:superfamily II DNA or RNA helicase